MKTDKFQQKYRIPSARASWHNYNGGEYFITICTKNREHYFGEIRGDEMLLSEIGKYAVENLEQINGHYPYCEIPLFVVMPNHIHAIVVIDENGISPVETMCTSSDEMVGNTTAETMCTSDEMIGDTTVMTMCTSSDDINNCDTTVETMCTSSDEMIGDTTVMTMCTLSDDINNCDTTVETMCTSSLQKQKQPNNRWKNKWVDEKMQSISDRRGKLSTAMGGFKRAITLFANENKYDFAWQPRFHDHIVRDQDEMNRIASYIENNALMWKEDSFHTT